MTVTVADKIRFQMDGIINTFSNSNIFVRSVRGSGVSTAFSLFATSKLVNGSDLVYVAKDKIEKAKFKDMLKNVLNSITFKCGKGSDIFEIEFGNAKSRLFIASAKDVHDLIEDIRSTKEYDHCVVEIDYVLTDRIDDWDLGSIISIAEYKDFKINRFIVNGNYVDIEGESHYKTLLGDASEDKNGWTLLEIYQPASDTFTPTHEKINNKLKLFTLSFDTLNKSITSIVKIVTTLTGVVTALAGLIIGINELVK